MNDDVDDEIFLPQSQRQVDIQTVKRAVEIAVPLAEIGHTFKNTWLEDVLGVPEPKTGTAREFRVWAFRRMQLIGMWCDQLLAEHGVHIENARGQGYVVIDPKLTSQVVAKDVKREVDKIHSQAFDKLTLTTAAGLTNAEIAARHDTMAWVGKMNMMLKHQRPRPPRPGVKGFIEAAPPVEE